MTLSVDLRERVLAAHERREGSQRVLAERFGVAVGTVNGWLRQAREGRCAPLRGRGGRAALGGAGAEELTAMVAESPDTTLAEYAEMLERPDGAAARAAWRAEVMDQVDPDRLVFLDESGLDTRLTRTYARAPRGQRGRPTRHRAGPRRQLAAPDHPRRAGPHWPGRGDDRGGGHQHRRLPHLHRNGADPAAARPSRGHARHGQPGPAQGRRRARGLAPSRARTPLPAGLPARPEPYRALLVQTQRRAAIRRTAQPRRSQRRPAERPRRHHPR